MGFALDVASVANEGATFSIILPLEAPERVEPTLVPLTPMPPGV